MRQLLSSILTVSVMCHATFGCCVHHSHSCESNCCDEPAVMASSCGCESHAHDEMTLSDEFDTTEQQHSRQHENHDCEGECCTFPSPEESCRLSGLENSQNLPLLYALDLSTLDSAASSTLLRRNLFQQVALYKLGSRLRLHLVIDVLLI